MRCKNAVKFWIVAISLIFVNIYASSNFMWTKQGGYYTGARVEKAYWHNIFSDSKEDGCLWVWQPILPHNAVGPHICYGSFVILPDIHNRYAPIGAPLDWGVSNVMKWLSTTYPNRDKLQFILLGGDICDQGSAADPSASASPAYYDNIINIMKSYSIPWIPVMGNHDMFYPWGGLPNRM
ncbi:MAG: metallophosphoesterase family protein [bacterium]|nr:metallophosphoesterase family protein [bacterium]